MRDECPMCGAPYHENGAKLSLAKHYAHVSEKMNNKRKRTDADLKQHFNRLHYSMYGNPFTHG